MTTHKIEGTEDLVMSAIKDQASDLEHGWREAIQNGIDSTGSTVVELSYDEKRSIIGDDGTGVDLTGQDGIDLLTNLGASSKKDDDSTIGEFGIGKGQIIAKGRTAMVSGDTALIYDIEEYGLEVKEVRASEASKYVDMTGVDLYPGLTVVVEHYTSEVPKSGSYRWERYENRVSARFRYVGLATGVTVKVNGKTVSDGEVTTSEKHSVEETFKTSETGPVHIAVRHGSSKTLSVYSKGVFVKDVDTRGLVGTVVTERNLDLNFARNEIKSGCPVWSAVSKRLDEIRGELFESMPDRRLNSEARDHVSRLVFTGIQDDDWSNFDRFKDAEVVRTTNEGTMSLNDVLSKGRIAFAMPTSKAADRVTEAYGSTVLDSTDPATVKFQKNLRKIADKRSVPELFDVEESAAEGGLMTPNRPIDSSNLRSKQKQQLAVAKRMAKLMGINRTVKYGESESAAAWTNGSSYIYITDKACPSRNRCAWIPELFETLVHEAAHDRSTKEGCASHGASFNQRYRELMENRFSALSQVMIDLEKGGIKGAIDGV